VAAGHGQFCDLFEPGKYTGIDFCPAMIELARQRHPGYEFHCVKFEERTEADDWREFDIVFQVNALRSMGMTPDRFRDLAMPFAKMGVLCFEPKEAWSWSKEP
jgi:hypothetical protein